MLLPLLGLLFASPKLLCALLAEPLQPELAHPAVQGNFGLGRAAPPSAQPDGTDRREAASALAHDSERRRSLRVKERELAQELEKQEEKPSESPPAAHSAPLPGA